MTPADRKGVDAAFARVQAILHRDWDPIGCGVPLDEYDSYAWPVLGMLRRGAPRAEIETYLRKSANESMLSPVPEKRLSAVVDSLMALDTGA